MQIDIDINSAMTYNGKRIGYAPSVRISIDNHDDGLDWNELKTLAPELETLILTRIREATV